MLVKARTLEAVHSLTARVDTIEERTLEAHPIEERTLEAHRTLEARKAAMLAVPSPTARVKPVEGTGIIFAPKCDNFCFTREAVCDHIKNTVPINNLGDYVAFPSKCVFTKDTSILVNLTWCTSQLNYLQGQPLALLLIN